MDTVKTLILLESALDEVGRLKRLRRKNSEFPVWYRRVTDILKEAFGANSAEYLRFMGSPHLSYPKTEKERQQAYVDYLTQREEALKATIQERRLSGPGQKPALGFRPPHKEKDEQNV